MNNELFFPENMLSLFDNIMDILKIKLKENEKLSELQSLLLAKMGNLKQ